MNNDIEESFIDKKVLFEEEQEKKREKRTSNIRNVCMHNYVGVFVCVIGKL